MLIIFYWYDGEMRCVHFWCILWQNWKQIGAKVNSLVIFVQKLSMESIFKHD